MKTTEALSRGTEGLVPLASRPPRATPGSAGAPSTIVHRDELELGVGAIEEVKISCRELVRRARRRPGLVSASGTSPR